MYRKLIILLLLVIPLRFFAQELNCRVGISAPQIPDITNEEKENMRKAIEEFVRNYKWTDNTYEEFEKIEVSISIILTKKNSSTTFTGSFQFVATRPVYNSTYASQTFSFFEEAVTFNFEESQVLDFDENTFTNNLTSVLAFYSYIIIGIDYDSFSKNGGSKYFQKAQNVVNAAQGSADGGWASTKRDNRYWLVENILNSSYSGFRSCLYIYHRLGLDVMHKDIPGSRKQIYNALVELEKVYKQKPNCYILTIFFYAKKDELINIFSEGQPAEISEAVTLLKKMDPGNASDYDKLIRK